MRKLLFIITVCLLMPFVARGQASYEWMYWFDSEHEVAVSGTGGKDLHLELDVGRLTPGVHKMHMMVRDVKTDRFCNPTASFFVVPEDIYGQDDIMYYWFDDDDRIIYHHAVVDGPIQLKVDSLSAGIHSFHTQVKNIETGRVCDPNKRFFIVPENHDDEKDIMYYWYDDDDAVVFHSPVSEGAVFLNVDTLNAGIHTINIQVKNVETGRVCNPVKRYFIVPERNADEGDIMYYWYDDDPDVVNKSLVKDGPVLLDVKDLSAGIHTLHIQVRNPETGRLSETVNRFFVVLDNDADEEAMFYYWFDENHADMVSAPVGDGALMLDVASLSEGIHMLHSYVKKDGRMSEPKHQVFVKQPVGGNAIAYYSYWLNEADTERNVVKVDEPTNPYELIDMLPVEPQPLRSSDFHFEVTDSQPTMYAKNDIHLTFTDLYGQESKPVSKQFVDVNTSEVVTDIAELLSTQTFARPEENKVKWFSFVAAPKDSVSLKSSQTATIQIFDATGNILYTADGNASTKFNGCCIVEEGTFYVAVHDVTGTKNDVTLEAQFDRTLFALTYIVDGDTLKTEAYEYRAAIEPLDEPTKEGYTFSGWSEIPEVMPAHNVTVTGSFAINQYLVSFIVEGDTVQADSLEFGSAITAPEDPTKEGYTFTGWDPAVDATVPAHDVTYVAQFTVNTYMVRYYVGEELVHEDEVEYGASFTLYEYTPEEGYVFKGWIGEMYETMPAHDIEYYADIETGIATVTSDANDNSTYYDLSGRKIRNVNQGRVIIKRLDNGRVVKVIKR